MVALLVKKQMTEIFRGYFYDQKKNKARSKVSIVLFILMFVGIMIGVLGGMFSYLAYSLCGGFAEAGMSWLYFFIMGMLSIALGTFGSVFNTFSGLYLSKDNDLLLSMPIPVSSILISRLVTVYLMGLMYSAVVIVPADIVYWIVVSASPAVIIGGILLTIQISLIVLIMSCVLGWCVAKVSLKLKNRSFVSVAVSLIFIGLYYFVYFKAQSVIESLLVNAALYGGTIEDKAYVLTLFGKTGTGNVMAMLLVTLITVSVTAVTYYVLAKSFIGIATSTGNVGRVAYRQKKLKMKNELGALFAKEMAKFTSSPNYMLNCGLGSLMLIAASVVMLVKGGNLIKAMNMMLGKDARACICVFVIAGMCIILSMNNMVVPSVSLEGKNLWILKSLPVNMWNVLKSKLLVQLTVTGVPLIICDICVLLTVKTGVIEKLFIVLITILFMLLQAFGGLALGIMRPNFTWTNEIVPIKQSMNMFIEIFGSFVLTAGILVPFLLIRYGIGYKISVIVYLLIVAGVLLLADLLLYRWLRVKGTDKFAQL